MHNIIPARVQEPVSTALAVLVALATLIALVVQAVAL